MNTKTMLVGVAVLAAAIVHGTPEVSNVTMTQSNSSRLVTITYNLSEDAVVTLEVMTNATPNAATGWSSIGGVAVCNAQGAVWRKVTSADADGAGKYTITWRPDQSWTDESGKGFKIAAGCAKAVVTAWALDNTPDYMVVDISAAAQPNTQKYYPAVDFLPGSVLGQKGAITNNPAYKTSMLVMRKIMAKDVIWTMGSTPLETQRISSDHREDTHQVSLTNNYYIGVFEITQNSWNLVGEFSSVQSGYFTVDRAFRPMENVCFNEIRNGRYTTAAASDSKNWPEPPYETSWLGRLRTRTGLNFDLPSEAQWEFAARAGHGDTQWGDGTAILNTDSDLNLARIGRYAKSGGYINGTTAPTGTCPEADGGTAFVGSYAPNDWGLYDMNGNVGEFCLDFFQADISSLAGAVNTVVGSGSHVVRGGDYRCDKAKDCRPAGRGSSASNERGNNKGVRVVCTAGLK